MEFKNLKIFKERDLVIAKDNTDFYYGKNFVEFPVKVIKSYKDGTMDVETKTGAIKGVNQSLFKKYKKTEPKRGLKDKNEKRIQASKKRY